MSVTATPYGAFLQALGSASVNLLSDTVNVLLTTSAYVPNMDTHAHLSDVTHEVTGTGYTTLGKTLASKTYTYDSTNKWSVFGAANVIWSGLTLTAHYAVVYKYTGTPSTSPLIGYVNFGADKTLSAEDFALTFTNGVLRVKAA